MKHYATPEFWYHYRAIPAEVRSLADNAFRFLKMDPRHPGIHLKKVGEYWSARIGLHYRAAGIGVQGGISWFWIGTHAEYDILLR